MHYSSLASSVDSAYATWHADVVGAKTISQLVAPAATYASELSTFDHSITGIGASGKAASDIQKLIAADNVVIGDLHALSSTTSAEFSSWGARIIAAGTSAVTASNVVRSDLGLAPSAG
jgi:hypothetical protein